MLKEDSKKKIVKILLEDVYKRVISLLNKGRLKREVIKRRKVVKLFGLKAFFPTPENLILLKVISGRPQDLVDIEKVIFRHRKRRDIKYLKSWAQKLCDEAQDM